MNKKTIKATDFDDVLREELKDPEFKKWFDYYGKQLEIAYGILQMRKKQGMSQRELAKKIGTTQSNIARMESGQQNFTVETLNKIAGIFNKNLKILFD